MVSLIVPVLNERAIVAESLAALRGLDGPKEIIVVDGGSTDGTWEVLRRQKGIRAVRSEPGRARQMNAGARLARGEILLFVHLDSRLPTAALPSVENACAPPGVVGGRFDLRLAGTGIRYRLTENLINLRSRVSGTATGDQCIFVRRSVFERLGGYADIPLMEDVELCRRLRRRGRFVALRVRVETSARRWERNGFWRTVLLMWSLRALYAAGASPERLSGFYKAVR